MKWFENNSWRLEKCHSRFFVTPDLFRGRISLFTFFFSLVFLVLLSACTDYVSQIDDRYGEWETSESIEESSSSKKNSSSSWVSQSEDETSLTDARDGQVYRIVAIGTQTWMAENLNYKTENSYCYNNKADNCSKYGRLYTWAAAMVACPDGWHLPSQTEWNTLFTVVGGISTAGKVLKFTSEWFGNGTGTDAFLFSALPTGVRWNNGNYDYEDYNAYFWSSTEYDRDFAFHVGLYYNDDEAFLYDRYKETGFSVRCLKGEMSDQTEKSSSSWSGELMTDARDGQTYKIVTIGSQTWMAQNLNYETENSYCYNDTASYCAQYGRLYTWAAAVGKTEDECGYGHGCALQSVNIQGACPVGWHLPSQREWEALFTAVGGISTAGKVLKSLSGWSENYDNKSGNGTDTFLFSAMPAGNRLYYEGRVEYNHRRVYATFWSSSEILNKGAFVIDLKWYDDVAELNSGEKNNGFSVRCLKDNVSERSAKSSGRVSLSSSSTEGRDFSSSSVAKSSNGTSMSSSGMVVDPADVVVGSMTDSRDGLMYKTVKIGNQTWMAQNLNYETADSYCYNDSASYCSKYGRLYTWAAAMDSTGTWSTNGKSCGCNKTCSPTYPVRGVCPEGWHLPTQTEWNTLFAAVGGSSTAGKKLKFSSGWNSSSDGSDAFSFSALPAGSRLNDGYFSNENNSAFFWSSTENSSYYAYYMFLHYDDDNADLNYNSKYYGFSVRCVKD